MTNNEFNQVIQIISNRAHRLDSSFEEAAVGFIDELIPTIDGELIRINGNREIYWSKLKFVMQSYLRNNTEDKLFQYPEEKKG